ncbi:1092_t:CDS:2 [Paraglomus occultum]|uniref:1092_t:CDS:1 n=1 Tax=Paraglomus occultum TaxID=144539 RepID=A0A9N9AU55_9GLOM|nr:1092_t:CDS:2 [Paraglomus occultum]
MLVFKFPQPIWSLRAAKFISPAYTACGFGRVMKEKAAQQPRVRRYEVAAAYRRPIGVERAFSKEKIKPPKVPRLREKEKEKCYEKEMSTDNIKSKSSSGLDLSSSLLVQQMLFSPKEKNSNGNDASREDVAKNIEKIIEDDPAWSKTSH